MDDEPPIAFPGLTSKSHAVQSHPAVLVVDDQEANVTLLRQMLERAGVGRITTTTDPREALRLFDELDPDLVLLDLHMPHLDGFAVLEELRRRTPASDYRPVLVLTADATLEAKQRALALGANDFLTKPFDQLEVVLRTRNLLETRSLHRHLQSHNRLLTDEVVLRTEQLRVSEEARAELIGALERLQSHASPEETAEVVCEELIGLPGIDAAFVALFRPGAEVVPLALRGPAGLPMAVNHPLPPNPARYLIERARLGPWVDESMARPEDGAYGEELRTLGFGSAIYAPLRIGGEVAGVLVGASLRPELGAELLARILPAVVDRAAVAAAFLAPFLEDRQRRAELQGIIRGVIERAAIQPVFQPIVDLERGTVLGYEALTRFDDGTRPDRRFAEAEEVGLLLELERACLDAAVHAADGLPGDAWLSVNISPACLLAPDLVREVAGSSRRPIVLELTEHMAVPDYGPLKGALGELRPGCGLAIDDAGAGFASFRHIIELEPDYVKLDIGLVRAIETDERRQALIAGLSYFAGKTGCTLIAEGIEREEERQMLRTLTVALGQGYLLGRPAAVGELDERRDLARRPFAIPAA